MGLMVLVPAVGASALGSPTTQKDTAWGKDSQEERQDFAQQRSCVACPYRRMGFSAPTRLAHRGLGHLSARRKPWINWNSTQPFSQRGHETLDKELMVASTIAIMRMLWVSG